MGGRHNGKDRNWLLIGLIATWMVFISAVAVWVAQPEPEPRTIVQRVPQPVAAQRTEPPRSEKPGVNPWCWSTAERAETTPCQQEVVAKTKFVPRYQTNQAALARTHPMVKTAEEGRGANSLARHGLLSCWMTEDADRSLDMMVAAFYSEWHNHPFKLKPDETIEHAAYNVQVVAVLEICPSAARAYENKGGPLKASDVRG